MNNLSTTPPGERSSTLEQLTVAVLTSEMIPTARLLVLAAHLNADDAGWWLATYEELAPFIGRTSREAASTAIKNAKKHGFLLTDREQDTFREITMNLPARYKATLPRSSETERRDTARRMCSETELRNPMLVSPQVASSSEIEHTTTVRYSPKDQNQDQNQTLTRNPPVADTTSICVSDSLREPGRQDQRRSLREDNQGAPPAHSKENTPAAGTNPYTKPRQNGVVRVDAALCFTCDNRHISISKAKTGKIITWCGNCDPDWDQAYEDAADNHRRWETDPLFRREMVG